jgi:hypothetical protein
MVVTVRYGPWLELATYTVPRSADTGVTTLVMGSMRRPVVWMVPVIGLPLAVAVLVLSERDLARMRRGLLDPAGGGRRRPGTSR